MEEYPKIRTLAETVNTLLSKSQLPSSLTIESCAAEMAMSMTSFRRKLAKEETSYKLIQNKYLNEMCVDALLKNQMHIDELAIKLGYSERATFERAFRQKFGITPSQFRELALASHDINSSQNLTEIAQNIPPMPESCRELMKAKDVGALDLEKVIQIVGKDPIFSARLMGLASKAIYGRTPANLLEAVSRNLGIETVVNFAVIYAMKDILDTQVEKVIIEQYSKVFLLAPTLFRLVRKSLTKEVKFDLVLTEQILVFSLLGVLLLSHKEADSLKLMMYSMKGIDDLNFLNLHMKGLMNISIFSASSLMLSLWNIDAALIKRLSHLDKVSTEQSKCNEQDELVFFMLSCLYTAATGHQGYSALEQKAQQLNIDDFDTIKELLGLGSKV